MLRFKDRFNLVDLRLGRHQGCLDFRLSVCLLRLDGGLPGVLRRNHGISVVSFRIAELAHVALQLLDGRLFHVPCLALVAGEAVGGQGHLEEGLCGIAVPVVAIHLYFVLSVDADFVVLRPVHRRSIAHDNILGGDVQSLDRGQLSHDVLRPEGRFQALLGKLFRDLYRLEDLHHLGVLLQEGVHGVAAHKACDDPRGVPGVLAGDGDDGPDLIGELALPEALPVLVDRRGL